LRIRSDAMRRIELALLFAGLAPGFNPVAVLIELRDARVDVAVTDEDIALRVPCDVGRLPELAVNWRPRRIHASPRAGFVGRFLFPAEHHDDASLWIELDYHI